MNESEFLALAEAILDAIEAQCDHWFEQLDIDVESARSGNVLTLTFADRSQVVINSQSPMREMWVAARSGGFHYRQVDGRWIDTRSGEEMAAALSRICTEQAGRPITVTLP
ncbi:iron donor protein CyaY [Pigmentiphaga soli]|uniref:Iron-sulfur cluster assembly protein CyaY n=1 Tax=Pigmentiphaga soli TaxID=1007095 RepID=A0ABP8HBL2_9BURK